MLPDPAKESFEKLNLPLITLLGLLFNVMVACPVVMLPSTVAPITSAVLMPSTNLPSLNVLNGYGAPFAVQTHAKMARLGAALTFLLKFFTIHR